MAKGNLFLGYAVGKVGDVVFSRQDGKQITRARNRSPKNPQTALQLTQRVIMKTSSLAFSLFQDICNHSFQGISGKTPNQSRFARLNVDAMRLQLADYINSGNPEDLLTCLETNFASKQVSMAPMREYIVSEGSIAPLDIAFKGTSGYKINPVKSQTVAQTGMTYQDFCDAFGLNAGDQLTFVGCSCNDTEGGVNGLFNGFDYARIILEPSDGDMTSLMFDAETGAINKPNPRNEGSVNIGCSQATVDTTTTIEDCHFSFPRFANLAGNVNSLAAATVIVSRLNGIAWERSSQHLHLRPNENTVTGHLNYDYSIWYLGDALFSYMTGQSSSLYLNQAENF